MPCFLWQFREFRVARVAIDFHINSAIMCHPPLFPQDFTISDGEDDDDKGSDIKDLEFRLSHNLQQLQVRLDRNSPYLIYKCFVSDW